MSKTRDFRSVLNPAARLGVVGIAALATLMQVAGCATSDSEAPPPATATAPAHAAAPAPGAAAAAPAAPAGSLFDRLGGKPAITAVVDEFVARVAADKRINLRFINTDIPQLKVYLV